MKREKRYIKAVYFYFSLSLFF